ncbi:MAG: O-methyltransferase [Planctomycetes bacterium]|nr:O-methyltransferase [Planctomycetota bacterium]
MSKKIRFGLLIFIVLTGSVYLLAQQGCSDHAWTARFGLSGNLESTNQPPLGKNEQEKKILEVLEDMYQHQRYGMMNVPPADGRILRLLTEAINAKHVVEIGTSNGYSTVWFCLALQKTGGKIATHEINTERASLARKNFKRAHVEHLVNLVEGDAHETVMRIKEPIDILFLDADKRGYPDYLNKLLPLVRPGGLIVAHNTSSHRHSPGMQKYINTVTSNPDLDTLFIHEHAAGIGITLKKR